MTQQNKIFALEGKVQHYQWGGFTFIPTLLSRSNDAQQPFAEYWLGAHAQAPAILKNDGALDSFIKSNPEVLGEKVKKQFGRLPYLLKVLDVKDMLSIQVHPSKKDAEKGFAAENASGLAATASNRNYKDDNHKPELAAALGEFWLLHGFRSPGSMKKMMQDVPEMMFLQNDFGEGDYQKVYSRVMEMDQAEVNKRLQPLLERILPAYEQNRLDKDHPDFWAARAAVTFSEPGKTDRGIFSVYLLNLVRLSKGEAIFQDAGILHAYLEGQNVEIMANSDNVLRGGLTPKHIDVPELMKHVSFKAVDPNILTGTPVNKGEDAFLTPAEDFELHVINLHAGQSTESRAKTVEIFVVTEGEATIEAAGSILSLSKGECAMSVAGAELTIRSLEGAELYRATVPQ
jgi:mannose-6-phosphate isomerase